MNNAIERSNKMSNSESKKIVIIGAGSARITTAYELLNITGYDIIVFEEKGKKLC